MVKDSILRQVSLTQPLKKIEDNNISEREKFFLIPFDLKSLTTGLNKTLHHQCSKIFMRILPAPRNLLGSNVALCKGDIAPLKSGPMLQDNFFVSIN